jgi:hypothetical protein
MFLFLGGNYWVPWRWCYPPRPQRIDDGHIQHHENILAIITAHHMFIITSLIYLPDDEEV